MPMEALKVSHLAAATTATPDNDDPSFSGAPGVSVKLLAQAVVALATKIDVLTAKLNADGGVTDTDYATNFASTVSATTLT